GPRFTIVTGLPYDRDNTTMVDFPMCDDCAQEYADPGDRRFHAQPIACPRCGPVLELVTVDGSPRSGEAALALARARLANGQILAVKGLGGYHLACDAADERAVAELRRRKRRGDKPFAVMAADVEVARQLVSLDATEEALLTGIRRPIVLAARKPTPATEIADSVAPGNPDLGVFLPYTPLHILLFGVGDDAEPGPRALVMTSGNLSGEPIVIGDDEAVERLAPLVDGWLRHGRRIRIPCDDSVSRVVSGIELPIRRSRGYAPTPIALPFEVEPMLAAGADLKNTCCVAAGRYAWVSQHIGDMEDLATVEALGTTERHLEMLTGVRPGLVVTDNHPGYHSTMWASAKATALGAPVRGVQHHHAHIASVMGEHGLDGSERVIGVAFDGTGYGTDGAIWGGEVLVADYKDFRRFAHLGYVPLPGGDASVQRPYRMALSHLHTAHLPWEEWLPSVDACPELERRVLRHQLDTGFGCVPTSSMGRLFDAVSSLAGVRQVVDYEAEAAIELEALARAVDKVDQPYAFAVGGTSVRGAPVTASAAAVLAAVVDDVRRGTAAEVVAARFHLAVVHLVAELAEAARRELGLDTVALGGGVFQNSLLLRETSSRLTAVGFRVLRPQLLPPNDAGLALGQILVGASG
ncbi:MAG: carbamoyltransferase HypF, partial [Nocardioidaceae bacterium]|nr:carbamoyltransferase HypF [Nocardioidaceae bacterium]